MLPANPARFGPALGGDEGVLPGSVGRMPASSNTAAMNWESAQHPADTKISDYNLEADTRHHVAT